MGNYSKRLSILTSGKQNGYCTICGNYGKLTRDHVPPKGCNNKNDTVLRIFPGYKSTKRPSQSGTNFKTLCSQCNSTRLGTEYDPELINLSNEITNIALAVNNKKLILPTDKLIFIKPQRIARAVIGHILAADAIDETENGLKSFDFRDALREYFLDEKALLPEKIDIYFWVYPSRQQIILKDAHIGFLGSEKDDFCCHILKFLPLAFWILWEKPASLKPNLSSLVPDKSMGVNDVHQIKVDFTNIPPIYFPETSLSNNQITALTNKSLIGSQKRGRLG